MSIIITGMTLDEFSDYGEYCQTLIGTGQAVELPPHGRLKDADALMCEWEVATNANGERFPAVSAENIQAAPTIIPAEPEEGE